MSPVTVTNTKTAFDADTNPDIDVKVLESSEGKIQFMLPDALSVRIDEGATYTYIGHSAPGGATSAGSWRIQRMTNADTTIVFADGDSLFNNVWDNRASLSYS